MVSKKNRQELLNLVQAYGTAKWNEGRRPESEGRSLHLAAKEATAATWAEIQFFINNIA